MKTNFLILLLSAITFTGCTKKCTTDQPTVLVENLGSSDYPVRLEIIDAAGRSQFSNNFINPGNKSETLSFSAGNGRYSITINKNGVYSYLEKDVTFESCGAYLITVSSTRTVTQVFVKKTN